VGGLHEFLRLNEPQLDRSFAETDARSGKAKRIRANPRVLVVPCSATGKLRGEQVEARAEILGPEALDVALCYGWIDGQKKTFDDTTWLQKFTPRGKRSIWSKINREKVQRLVESGRMQSPGLEAVDRAKANGQWDSAYDSHRTAGVPDDLQRALDAHPKAKAFFATLNSANRYAILFRIQTVKRAETRAKKIEQFVGMLERHEVIHS